MCLSYFGANIFNDVWFVLSLWEVNGCVALLLMDRRNEKDKGQVIW